MRISRTVALLPLCLLLFGQTRAQDAEEIVRQSAARYRTLEAYDMEADVTVVTSTPISELEYGMRVRMAARPPGFVRAEVDSREVQILLVTNDQGTWMYWPDRNEYVYSENGTPSEIGAVSEDLLGEYAQLDARVERAMVVEADTLVVGGIPRPVTVVDVRYEPVETRAGADSIDKRLWIDLHTGLVLIDDTRSYLSVTPLGGPWRIHEVTRFTRVDIDEPPAQELFAFVPPDGASERQPSTGEGGESISEGMFAPAISLLNVDGESVALSDFEGQVVLVNFWATWCGPCRMEMSELDGMLKEHAEKGLTVLGVNLGESEMLVRTYLEQAGITFPVLLDAREDVGRRYGVQWLPTTVVVDRQGRISSVMTGAHPASSFLDAARRAGL